MAHCAELQKVVFKYSGLTAPQCVFDYYFFRQPDQHKSDFFCHLKSNRGLLNQIRTSLSQRNFSLKGRVVFHPHH